MILQALNLLGRNPNPHHRKIQCYGTPPLKCLHKSIFFLNSGLLKCNLYVVKLTLFSLQFCEFEQMHSLITTTAIKIQNSLSSQKVLSHPFAVALLPSNQGLMTDTDKQVSYLSCLRAQCFLGRGHTSLIGSLVLSTPPPSSFTPLVPFSWNTLLFLLHLGSPYSSLRSQL